jgi:hypothetical protein
MAQMCNVIQADPWTLATQLGAYTAGVTLVEKTSSAGKFLVVVDSTLPANTYAVIAGDPSKLALDLNTLVLAGKVIQLVIPTFSASHYVVAYT